MIKEIYLYNQRRSKRLFPELVIIQTKFFSTSSDLSLEELADVLIEEVHSCYGKNYDKGVKIKPYAPDNLDKIIICGGISPLRKIQMRKFEGYLSGKVSISWIEKEKTKQ